MLKKPHQNWMKNTNSIYNVPFKYAKFWSLLDPFSK